MLAAAAAATFAAAVPLAAIASAAMAVSLAAALVAAPAVAPYVLAVRTETAAWKSPGHESQWCSAACTSLVIPSRVQLVSAATKPLTERNHQNVTDGASYLGFVPLAATLAVAIGRRRVRALDPYLLAGALGVVLALGPRLRVFDRLLAVPLPYALVERLVPALRLGGCVNRFVALASLPLALGTALCASRLLARRAAASRALVIGGGLLAAVEYAPVNPGVAVRPYSPPDPAMLAIARSTESGNVLDVDGGAAALIRQLRHGRPQTLGYVSRTPPALFQERLEDPVVGPLIHESLPPFPVPPAAAGALLRRRWGAAFVVSPDVEPYRARARRLGFPLFARTEGVSWVWRVPDEPLSPLLEVQLAETADSARAPSRGAFAWGFAPPATIGLLGRTYQGRWCGAEAGILAPLAAGRHELLAATLERPTRVLLRWGKGRELARTITTLTPISFDVTADDLAGDGTLLLTIAADTFGAPGTRDEAFVVSLARRDETGLSELQVFGEEQVVHGAARGAVEVVDRLPLRGRLGERGVDADR
jgi:hypothetical protein